MLKTILRLIMRALYRVEVDGISRLREAGPGREFGCRVGLCVGALADRDTTRDDRNDSRYSRKCAKPQFPPSLHLRTRSSDFLTKQAAQPTLAQRFPP